MAAHEKSQPGAASFIGHKPLNSSKKRLVHGSESTFRIRPEKNPARLEPNIFFGIGDSVGVRLSMRVAKAIHATPRGVE
jgi:hypothetical protein